MILNLHPSFFFILVEISVFSFDHDVQRDTFFACTETSWSLFLTRVRIGTALTRFSLYLSCYLLLSCSLLSSSGFLRRSSTSSGFLLSHRREGNPSSSTLGVSLVQAIHLTSMITHYTSDLDINHIHGDHPLLQSLLPGLRFVRI